MYDLCVVQHEYGVRQRGGIRGLLRRESQPYDRSGESCRAVLAFSPVDLQEATSEPGIRVAEYCLVINHYLC